LKVSHSGGQGNQIGAESIFRSITVVSLGQDRFPNVLTKLHERPVVDAPIHKRISGTFAVRSPYHAICRFCDDRVEYGVVCTRYGAPKIGLPRGAAARWRNEAVGLLEEARAQRMRGRKAAEQSGSFKETMRRMKEWLLGNF